MNKRALFFLTSVYFHAILIYIIKNNIMGLFKRKKKEYLALFSNDGLPLLSWRIDAYTKEDAYNKAVFKIRELDTKYEEAFLMLIKCKY